MFPAKFAYAAPSSLQEALDLLEDPDAKILAGGHSLLPLMKLRLAQPKLLVDIGRIPGLSYVRSENGQLAIGAMTTYREIQHSDEVHQPGTRAGRGGARGWRSAGAGEGHPRRRAGAR